MLLGDSVKANNLFKRCLHVTEIILKTVINDMSKCGIEHLVAPFEADAQLAFLSNYGLVDFIITEDSDLILYGCEQVNQTFYLTLF
jgi:exonuclease-1